MATKFFAPWGRTLLRNGGKKDAVISISPTPVLNTLKLYMGANTGPNAAPLRPQTCVGTMRKLQSMVLTEWPQHVDGQNLIISGHWRDASNANIVVATDTSAFDDDTIAFLVSFGFLSIANGRVNSTHFLDETMNQLINVFNEASHYN